jgi:ATP-dependent RNA helicase DDX46/PRP5
VQVGGRSVVNADIAQFVEIRPEADRFLRLLEILGEWYEVGKMLFTSFAPVLHLSLCARVFAHVHGCKKPPGAQ